MRDWRRCERRDEDRVRELVRRATELRNLRAPGAEFMPYLLERITSPPSF